MKKTYKPISRTEKASQMFKKKTLNLHDQFNIKQDEDNIENVDDYWETANSVIGNQTIDSIESTELHEESDTLFDLQNIRKSVQGVDNRNVSKTNKKRKRLTLKPGSDDKEDFLEISYFENKQKDEEMDEKKGKEQNYVESRKNMGNIDNEFSNQYETGFGLDEMAEEEPIEYDVEKNQSSSDFDSKIKNETKDRNNDDFINKDMLKIKNTKMSNNENNVKFKEQNSIIVENVREIGVVNKVKPLVCTDEINTAILELDYLALTNEENAEKPFSVFVVKGKVVIKSGDKKTVLKNGEATVIRKNQLYSIICESKNGASLFISYAL